MIKRMRRIQPYLATLLASLLLSATARAQTSEYPPPGPDSATIPERPSSDIWRGGELIKPDGKFSRVTRAYRGMNLPPVQFGNSGRLEQLILGGNLYLSLDDAIALALENNLDVELQRYGSTIADANVLRAEAGSTPRGSLPSVVAGPGSATAISGGSGTTGSTLQTSTGSSTSTTTGVSTASTTTSTSSTQTTSTTSGSPNGSGSSSSTNLGSGYTSSTGPTVPSFDPIISAVGEVVHATTPQSNTVVSGLTAYVQDQNLGQAGISQSFLTGTSYSFGYSDSQLYTNSFQNLYNPSRTASLSLNITQHLLQGFGRAVNSRYIVEAKNNREYADLQFKQQVITTVVSVMNLYWDLVSFLDDVKAKQTALEYNQRLYEDNKRQVAVGTLAPIEIIRAEAAVASSQQDLTISQTRVLQQESTLKSYLSRTGVASPTLAYVHVIPTDRITIPEREPIQPIQDLTSLGLSSRPEVAQARINVTNARVGLRGSRSELRPTLDVFASLSNNALVGSPNTLPIPPDTTGSTPIVTSRVPNPYFLGGYGNLLSQLFDRNFPNYSAGIQLNIPLRNRAAQADYILDQASLREQEISVQTQENQVRLDVQNAIIGLQQARVTYDAAVKARILEEQTLDAELKKLKMGASTVFNVIQVQRDLAAALSSEVSALSAYSKARVELERSTGQTLVDHNISLREAFNGYITRAPSALPRSTSGHP